jgi:hypothetical protein
MNELLKLLYDWLPIFINTENYFPEEERLLDSLINRGDFDKYSLIIKLHVELKKNYSILLSEEQKNKIMQTMTLEKDKTLLQTISLNYQNMKYISNDNVKDIFEYIFDEERFEISSLLLCVNNCNYLFDELINLIREKYLNSGAIISRKFRYHILQDSFYCFIMSAYNHNKITKEEYVNAFKDEDFIDTLLTYLPNRIKKDGYDFNKWVVFSWEQIKIHCNIEQKSKYADQILFTLDDVVQPTEDSLDLYLDVIPHCVGEKYFSSFKTLLPYFDINYKKANKLLNEIIHEYTYVGIKELEEIMPFYSKDESKIRDGKCFLKKLKVKGVIDSMTMEKYARILSESADSE